MSITPDLLYNVIHGLADDVFHPLRVLLSHPLQSDAERCLFGAAVISEQHDISTRSQQTREFHGGLITQDKWSVSQLVSFLTKLVKSNYN